MSRTSIAHGSRTVKAVMLGAEQHADDLGDSSTGPEHLLLAAIDLPDGDARRAFDRIGVDPGAVRAAIIDTHVQALRALGIEPVPEDRLGRGTTKRRERFNKTAVSTIRRAGAESKRDRSRAFGLHVVAAVAQLEHGTAPRALRGMGVDLDELLVAARTEAIKAGR